MLYLPHAMVSTLNDYSTRAKDLIDSATKASLELERLRAKVEPEVNTLVKRYLEVFQDFQIWEGTLQNSWSEHPQQYDQAAHTAINRTYTLLDMAAFALRFCVEVVEDKYGVTINKRDDFMRHMQQRLSIRSMDSCVMPEHIAKLTREASGRFDSAIRDGDEWPPEK